MDSLIHKLGLAKKQNNSSDPLREKNESSSLFQHIRQLTKSKLNMALAVGGILTGGIACDQQMFRNTERNGDEEFFRGRKKQTESSVLSALTVIDVDYTTIIRAGEPVQFNDPVAFEAFPDGIDKEGGLVDIYYDAYNKQGGRGGFDIWNVIVDKETGGVIQSPVNVNLFNSEWAQYTPNFYGNSLYYGNEDNIYPNGHLMRSRFDDNGQLTMPEEIIRPAELLNENVIHWILDDQMYFMLGNNRGFASVPILDDSTDWSNQPVSYPLNSPGYEASLEITPNRAGDRYIFVGGQWDDQEGYKTDVYRVKYENGRIVPPLIRVDEINTDSGSEGVGFIIDDKLYYYSNESGQYDIYVATFASVQRPDADGDGVPDERDNCVNDANPGQEDQDGDALGDACDPCPTDPQDLCGEESTGETSAETTSDTGVSSEDLTGGATSDETGGTTGEPSAGSTEEETGNTTGGREEGTGDPNDIDGDGIANLDDNCPEDANPGQEDTDGDLIGDECDIERLCVDNDGNIIDGTDLHGRNETIDGFSFINVLQENSPPVTTRVIEKFCTPENMREFFVDQYGDVRVQYGETAGKSRMDVCVPPPDMYNCRPDIEQGIGAGGFDTIFTVASKLENGVRKVELIAEDGNAYMCDRSNCEGTKVRVEEGKTVTASLDEEGNFEVKEERRGGGCGENAEGGGGCAVENGQKGIGGKIAELFALGLPILEILRRKRKNY